MDEKLLNSGRFLADLTGLTSLFYETMNLERVDTSKPALGMKPEIPNC